MDRTALVVVLAGVLGCVTANPRGVMIARSPTGGEVAIYDAEDGEASQKAALDDAGRQMAAACAPRGWVITGMGLHDTGTFGHAERDSGGSRGPTIKVKKLVFECREAAPKAAAGAAPAAAAPKAVEVPATPASTASPAAPAEAKGK